MQRQRRLIDRLASHYGARGPWRALLALLLCLALLGGTHVARAEGAGRAGTSPGDSVYYVAPGGDCGGAAPCYATVQAAVDAASDSALIKVAAGTYGGVVERAGLAQVAYVTRPLALRGGYRPGDWTSPDPGANVTTLDAQGAGRGLYISGTVELITVTVGGLRITGGDASGLGGGLAGADAGGAIYAQRAVLTVADCLIEGNTASTTGRGDGGGLFLRHSATTLTNNTVRDNRASAGPAGYGYGGGLYVDHGAATTRGDTLRGNTASVAGSGSGGALYGYYADLVVADCTLQDNVASAATTGWGWGGGVYLYLGNATLTRDVIRDNRASARSDLGGQGGGLYLTSAAATLDHNQISGNVAHAREGGGYGHGGGIYATVVQVSRSTQITLTGNTIVDNTASAGGLTSVQNAGGGLYLEYTLATLRNNIVTGNSAVRGAGLFLARREGGAFSARLLHTTIVANHGDGIYGETLRGAETTLSQAYAAGDTLYVASSDGFRVGDYLVVARGDGSAREARRVVAVGPGSLTLDAPLVSPQPAGTEVKAAPAVLVNSIISGQTGAGVRADAQSVLALEGTLWYSNTTNLSASGDAASLSDYTGDPAYRDAAHGDYHLTPGSEAIDRGSNAGVSEDIDGDPRPIGPGYDLGADEWRGLMTVNLPVVRSR